MIDQLRAVLDRLIPADDQPGALAAGVDLYVLRQLAGDAAGDAPFIAAGLALLDDEANTLYAANGFADLDAERADAMLSDIERGVVRCQWAPHEPGRFFERLVELAHEGFYADPANGGNRDGVAWILLGYEPG